MADAFSRNYFYPSGETGRKYPKDTVTVSAADLKGGAMEKILCVDDEAAILQLYEEEFSEDGYEVILAANGREALIKYQSEHPQLVIMDLRLPGMDGIDLLNAILGKDRQALIIINTAYPQYRDNFMTWGAEAYLVKSSDLSELKQEVREVLGKRHAAKAPRDYQRHLGSLTSPGGAA